MDLKIKASFSAKDLEKDAKAFTERVFNATLREFINVLLKFIDTARKKTPDDGSFNDQTGNLRSSIGGIIFYQGQEVYANFHGAQSEGINKAREYATTLGKEFNEGWAIITVAGMEYASWVESKGKDVITGSTLGADEAMRNAFKSLDKAFK